MSFLKIKIFSVFFMTVFLLLIPSLSLPTDKDFADWLVRLRAQAKSQGVSDETLDSALTGLKPIQRVIDLDRRQPEFILDFQNYLETRVTKKRIRQGRMMLSRHRDILEKVKQRYGVQPRFLVAIWGLETSYGNHLGNFPVIGALATLAYDARRSDFFRSQLLNALIILDQGHIRIQDMKGSWAGAMGQVQFMPSTFSQFAVDADGDGRKDIWHNLDDAFYSAANFLVGYGWQSGKTWGMEVQLPSDFRREMAGLDKKKPLTVWQAMGIRGIDGKDLPSENITASVVLPSANTKPAFLVFQNYRSIMRWNNSHSYALSVCRLADLIAEKKLL
jgi:membrane-bound lytic murein transglycosylase B